MNLPYLGEHNVKNALAATALAMNVGASLADVKAGLEHRSQVKGLSLIHIWFRFRLSIICLYRLRLNSTLFSIILHPA